MISDMEKELRQMVGLLNEKALGRPVGSRLELRLQKRFDIGGVLAFIVLVQDGRVDLGRKTVVVPVPPVTLCWGGGRTADLACKAVIEKFSAGSDMLRRYVPFTAGSLEELKLKAAACYG